MVAWVGDGRERLQHHPTGRAAEALPQWLSIRMDLVPPMGYRSGPSVRSLDHRARSGSHLLAMDGERISDKGEVACSWNLVVPAVVSRPILTRQWWAG